MQGKIFRQLLAKLPVQLKLLLLIKSKFAPLEDGRSNSILATRGSDLLQKVSVLKNQAHVTVPILFGFECGNLIAEFKTFNAVRLTWFGNVLNSSYRDSTFSFERAYKAFRISDTPKVHAVIKHIPEFFDNQPEKHDIIQ